MNEEKKIIDVGQVVIRFSGDSGDGMQLTGTLFSDSSALEGKDIATFPDYPAEIRAPQGTVGGVSGFQVHFGDAITTPGDYADVLVAMNPAALKANARWVKRSGTIIYNSDAFDSKNMKRAGYKTDDPFEEDKLKDRNLVGAPITMQTKETLKDSGLDNKSILRCKNMFALGILYHKYSMPLTHTESFFEIKFKKNPKIVEANKKVLHAGFNFAEMTQQLRRFQVPAAKIEKGKYRNINGNVSVAWGLIAGAEKAKLPLFLGSYPITPASEILQELSGRKDLGVKTFQAEDEIAGICSAIGASIAGNLATTTTSGPGLALKTEAVGLAVITELPLVVVNVQRGGPSTGLPTKTEQADLLQALYGRNGESPVVVLAASSPANCFDYAFMACKIALEHMTPVILLTDGFLANGSQPMKIPIMADLPDIKSKLASKDTKDYQPYARDPETLARQWAVPGTPGLEHRLGSLEKMNITGTVSYVPENHELMCKLRGEKVQRIEKVIPELKVEGENSGELLVVGWGGTYGHLTEAVKTLQNEGKSISLAHFNYINPLPTNTKEVFNRFNQIIVCELNLGQFATFLKANYSDFKCLKYNKVQGLPFTTIELIDKFRAVLENK